MKSILQYPGSKWRIAKQIVSLLPPHHTYLEPYFGSGAVLFNKSRSDIETINDLDENVVNFFQWLKNDPEKLAHELCLKILVRQNPFNKIFTILQVEAKIKNIEWRIYI